MQTPRGPSVLRRLRQTQDSSSCNGARSHAASRGRRSSRTTPRMCPNGPGIEGRWRLRCSSVLTNSSHLADARPSRQGLNWAMALRAPEPVADAAPPVRKGITRRQALAAAVATGVGVGAVRLLGGTIQNLSHSGAASGTDWVSPLGRESARVMQLLRRTSFGYTQAQLDAALSDGYSKTVDRLLETKPAEPPVLAAAVTPGGRFGVPPLQQWWVGHMLTTPTPFAERMTMYWQNLTWRRMGMTNLRSMLMDVTTDPAMLRYLDLATSTGQSPNENYSRELMELFTMGAGNYTEEDVRQSAKALAGWQQPQPDSTATVI